MKQSVLQKLKSKWRSTSTVLSNENEVDQKPVWLKVNMSREESEYFLADQEIGVFFVRKSESVPDCFVLSVKVPKFVNSHQVSHYLILKTKKGFCIRGFQKEFNDIKSLVTHCSYMRDMLPVQLNLEHYDEKKKNFNEFCYYFNSTSSLNSLSSGQSDFSDLSEFDFTPSTSTSVSSNLFDDGFF